MADEFHELRKVLAKPPAPPPAPIPERWKYDPERSDPLPTSWKRFALWGGAGLLLIVLVLIVGDARETTARRARATSDIPPETVSPIPSSPPPTPKTPEEREAQRAATRNAVDKQVDQGRRQYGNLDQYHIRKAMSDEEKAERVCTAFRAAIAPKRLVDLTIADTELLSNCTILGY